MNWSGEQRAHQSDRRGRKASSEPHTKKGEKKGEMMPTSEDTFETKAGVPASVDPFLPSDIEPMEVASARKEKKREKKDRKREKKAKKERKAKKEKDGSKKGKRKRSKSKTRKTTDALRRSEPPVAWSTDSVLRSTAEIVIAPASNETIVADLIEKKARRSSGKEEVDSAHDKDVVVVPAAAALMAGEADEDALLRKIMELSLKEYKQPGSGQKEHQRSASVPLKRPSHSDTAQAQVEGRHAIIDDLVVHEGNTRQSSYRSLYSTGTNEMTEVIVDDPRGKVKTQRRKSTRNLFPSSIEEVGADSQLFESNAIQEMAEVVVDDPRGWTQSERTLSAHNLVSSDPRPNPRTEQNELKMKSRPPLSSRNVLPPIETVIDSERYEDESQFFSDSLTVLEATEIVVDDPHGAVRFQRRVSSGTDLCLSNHDIAEESVYEEESILRARTSSLGDKPKSRSFNQACTAHLPWDHPYLQEKFCDKETVDEQAFTELPRPPGRLSSSHRSSTPRLKVQVRLIDQVRLARLNLSFQEAEDIERALRDAGEDLGDHAISLRRRQSAPPTLTEPSIQDMAVTDGHLSMDEAVEIARALKEADREELQKSLAVAVNLQTREVDLYARQSLSHIVENDDDSVVAQALRMEAEEEDLHKSLELVAELEAQEVVAQLNLSQESINVEQEYAAEQATQVGAVTVFEKPITRHPLDDEASATADEPARPIVHQATETWARVRNHVPCDAEAIAATAEPTGPTGHQRSQSCARVRNHVVTPGGHLSSKSGRDNNNNAVQHSQQVEASQPPRHWSRMRNHLKGPKNGSVVDPISVADQTTQVGAIRSSSPVTTHPLDHVGQNNVVEAARVANRSRSFRNWVRVREQFVGSNDAATSMTQHRRAGEDERPLLGNR